MKPVILKTRRLVLRPIRMADLPSIYGHACHEIVAKNAGFPSPKSIADTRKYVRLHASAWQESEPRIFTFSMLDKNSRWVGGINLRWAHVGVGEIGYSVHPDHWGHGYAPEAVKKIVDWAFRQGAHRVQATCWTGNQRSAKVLVKSGFKKEGKLRDYFKRGDWVRDEFMWGVTRTDWKAALGGR